VLLVIELEIFEGVDEELLSCGGLGIGPD